MRRRKNNDDDLLELILKLGGVAIVLALLSPGIRNFISALGTIVVVLLILSVLVLLGILVYEFIKHKRTGSASPFTFQDFSNYPINSSIPVIPPIEPPEPEVYTTTKLIEKLRTIDWFQFEKLVALIYEHQGYDVTRRGGANPDGGIDLVIEKDGQQSAVQCKQWKSWNVGVKAVREFLGAMTDAQFQHGIFITLNGYTGDAKLLADKHGIKIINEAGLTAMLNGLNIHEDPRVMEFLNDTRKFCPKCERLMVERVAGKGPNPGQRFWGCTGYPKCRFTMPFA
jgi:hypothetical protein